MKRVIVTGGTGFVGANLVRRLLREGHEVHLLLRPDYNAWRIQEIRSHLQMHKVDFHDRGSLSATVGQIRPDWVFHLAAYGAYSWQNDLSRMVQTNIAATINLVEACLKTGFEVFINTGSSSEYGFKDHAASETEWVEPNSYYAVTKASATLFCRFISQSHGVPIVTLRLYSVYGPYEEPTRLIPTLLLQGLNASLPPLVKPEISRDFVYIEDVEKAYLLAANLPNQEFGMIYNVGTGIQTSMHEVVEVARRVMGIVIKPEWATMPNRNWDTDVWVADNRKIHSQLGWQPSYTFEQGFRKMVSWIRADPELLVLYQKLNAQGNPINKNSVNFLKT